MSKRRGCLTKADLSPHDLAEVEKFETFLRLAGEKKKAGIPREQAQHDAHAEIYGEVIYPKAQP